MNSRLITDGELLQDDDNPDLEAEFRAFRDGITQDQQAEGFIKIFRLPLDAQGNPRSNSMRQSLLCTLPLGAETIDDICDRVRRDYIRPGENRITICVRGYQSGKSGIRFQKILTIERENAPEAPKESNTMGDVAAMLRLMQQEREASAARTENFLREMMAMQMQNRMQAAPPTALDPIAMMQQVGTMMTIFQGMMSGMMRPGGAAPVDPMTDFMTRLEQMKKINGLLGGGGDSDEGTVGIIKAVTPLAAPILQLMAAQAGQRPMRRKQLPKAAPAAPAASVQESPPAATAAPVSEGRAMSEDEQMKIREALNELCDMAERAEDPVACAALALDLLPEEHDKQVGALVSDPETCFAKICLLCPRARKFPTWFESLRVEMARAYEEDPDGAEDDEGEED